MTSPMMLVLDVVVIQALIITSTVLVTMRVLKRRS